MNNNGNGKIMMDPDARQLNFLAGKAGRLVREMGATVTAESRATVLAAALLRRAEGILQRDVLERERRRI